MRLRSAPAATGQIMAAMHRTYLALQELGLPPTAHTINIRLGRRRSAENLLHNFDI
jgi:hypothetical protein